MQCTCQCRCALPLPGLVARLFLQSPGRPPVRGQLEVKSPSGRACTCWRPAQLKLAEAAAAAASPDLVGALVPNLVARGCVPV